jgi:DNA helicase HerA-like ATPase
MKDFEKLGVFYLGKRAGPGAPAEPELILYDSKDLTTHGVIVGMTVSGKTGLGIGLIEEAAIDGIPTIAVDPKGDLGNLLLTFPKLAPADFAPWVEDGVSAEETAAACTKGLAAWGE